MDINEYQRKRHIILYRSYLISVLFIIIAMFITYNLFKIQNNPDKYKKFIIKRTKKFKLNSITKQIKKY
ncbi:hypothetical protein [Blattabacterium cuenoti]|uniref:hypothetical protein n=1 Tax=Blattabacterium cuenoti TaxID=1653831 RepID=UPI00163BA472|nr:hypothetical protein [Blattabacterium cuenoti]